MQADFTGVSRTLFPIFLRSSPRGRLGQTDSFQRLSGGDCDQLVEHFFTKHLVDALAVSIHRRGDQHGIGGRMQFEVLVRMGERVMRDQRCDVGKFRGLGLQKFLASRSVEEKVTHGNRRTQGKSSFFHFENFASVNFDYGSGRFIGSLGLQAKARD